MRIVPHGGVTHTLRRWRDMQSRGTMGYRVQPSGLTDRQRHSNSCYMDTGKDSKLWGWPHKLWHLGLPLLHLLHLPTSASADPQTPSGPQSPGPSLPLRLHRGSANEVVSASPTFWAGQLTPPGPALLNTVPHAFSSSPGPLDSTAPPRDTLPTGTFSTLTFAILL